MCLFGVAMILLIVSQASEANDFEKLKDVLSRSRRSDKDKLEADVELLARQLMMQQFYVEEQTRSNGASGLKRIRLNSQGSRPYLTPTYGDHNFAAIHNHANYDRTIGLGELIVVLNGVEFRTRHLDYKMMMKSTTSTKYGAMEAIPFPDVPPEVSSLKSVSDQMKEMKEWFKAFKAQNYKERDYRKYFKPVLCYLEGMWTNSDQYDIEESFDSDRHHLDATSWLDMQEKTRFTTYTGAKDILENYAYLPTTVIDTGSGGAVSMAQWNFKISCHPLSDDVPTGRLILVEDIKARLANNMDWRTYYYSRAARFRVSPMNKGKFVDKAYRRNYLDDLMEQAPGMDNYPADVKDDALGDVAYPYGGGDKPKNVGYFHRWFRSLEAGAMGLKTRHRSFGDENVFMAMNTQDKVAGVHVEKCKADQEDNCQSWTQKWSYAIPLEIIYLTPLSKWNPYKVKSKASGKSGDTAATALDGIQSDSYYMTPADFFSGEVGEDPADTTVTKYVLDHKGTPREMSASGHRGLMNVTDVGVIRQRYPIMPLHEEGGTTWKHMEALMDIVLEPQKFSHLLRGPVSSCSCAGGGGGGDEPKTNPGDVIFEMLPSSIDEGSHVHRIILTAEEFDSVKNGEPIFTSTTKTNGHVHAVWVKRKIKGQNMFFQVVNCDGVKLCPDGHGKDLTILD